MDNLKKEDIIIELGSQWIRIGLVGDRTPRKTLPTSTLMTYHPQHSEQYQIKLEQTLFTIFYSYINSSCQGKTVIILENLFTDRRILEIMAKIMFKKLKIDKLELALCCVTPLYLTAKYSGIVVLSGASTTQIMPIYESYPLFRCFQYTNLGTHSGNKRIRDELALMNSQVKSQVFEEMSEEYINQVRNVYSCIPCNMDTITITFKRSKLKFDPKVIDFSQLFGNVDNEQFNISYAFVQMLQQLPTECLNDVCSNVILAGGLWRIKGMQNYFKKCVSAFLKYKEFEKLEKLKVRQKLKFVSWGFNPSELSWIGCSVGSSVRSIEHLTLKRNEYTQLGFKEKIMQNYFNEI